MFIELKVIAPLEMYFVGFPENYYKGRNHKVNDQWNKFIEVKVDYTEK